MANDEALAAFRSLVGSERSTAARILRARNLVRWDGSSWVMTPLGVEVASLLLKMKGW